MKCFHAEVLKDSVQYNDHNKKWYEPGKMVEVQLGIIMVQIQKAKEIIIEKKLTSQSMIEMEIKNNPNINPNMRATIETPITKSGERKLFVSLNLWNFCEVPYEHVQQVFYRNFPVFKNRFLEHSITYWVFKGNPWEEWNDMENPGFFYKEESILLTAKYLGKKEGLRNYTNESVITVYEKFYLD